MVKPESTYTLEELQAGQLVLIDKPLDWTSFDVVKKIRNRIRKQFNIKKIKVGHAGTLDPRATGLLVICIGKFTKRIAEIQDTDKVYSGLIKLGATTASYDTETPEENPIPVPELDLEAIQTKANTFLGEIQQKPPVHSAIKKDGKRLYEYARKGQEVAVPTRLVNIQSFQIEKVELPFVSFRVHCGKGTYIRSLAHDLGKALGCGGYLYALRREQIGKYKVADAQNEWVAY